MKEYLTPEDIETAKANGINYDLLMKRFHKLDWGKERAITEEVNARKKYVELAVSNGIKKITYFKRVERGIPPEEAATMPVMTPKQKGRLISEAKRRGLHA